jgi:hypothetical protein
MLNEKEYIARCKRLIEEKFGLGTGGKLRQRDLEYISESIAEKSGIRLSLSTLKRLWQEDYGKTPHPPTLSALVSLLGYKDWQEFRLAEEQKDPTAPAVITQPKKQRVFMKWVAIPLLALVLVVFWLIAFNTHDEAGMRPMIKGPVTFSGNKTVSQGVPNTIIFNYDVSNIEADSFFFQQSWNEMEKVKIDPEKHYYSCIYYLPGYHKAKLIANDTILKRFPVHIKTADWLPLVRYAYTDNMPVYVADDSPFRDGRLHVTSNDLVSNKVDVNKEFLLSYYNVRDFENTNSSNFTLETGVASDRNSAAPCPAFELVIICEVHIFYIRMMGKGCERNAGIKMGEVIQDGVDHDLSAFGRDLYETQNIKVSVKNKHAEIFLDGTKVHTVIFKEDFGKVMGLTYTFLGTGSIDYVKLTNGSDKVVMEEDFN